MTGAPLQKVHLTVKLGSLCCMTAPTDSSPRGAQLQPEFLEIMQGWLNLTEQRPFRPRRDGHGLSIARSNAVLQQ